MVIARAKSAPASSRCKSQGLSYCRKNVGLQDDALQVSRGIGQIQTYDVTLHFQCATYGELAMHGMREIRKG